MTFKNESSFKKYILDKLKQDGWFCQNLESRQTGVGIPDTFILKSIFHTYIEFKYDKTTMSEVDSVAWRPGQKAWAFRYYNASTYVGMFGTSHFVTWTVVGCTDGILLIKMAPSICRHVGPLSKLPDLAKQCIHMLSYSDSNWFDTFTTYLTCSTAQ